MIFFGWGKTTVKDFGPSLPTDCRNCEKSIFLHYVKRRKWFTLYFIPIFPYNTMDLLLCPVCGDAYALDSSQTKAAEEQCLMTKRFKLKRLSEKRYLDSVGKFHKVLKNVT